MTEKIAQRLAVLLADRGAIRRDETELYMFGFQAGLEFMSCLLVSLAAALVLHRALEYLIVLAVFIPVRSYAGGFHFEKFGFCFLSSCAVIAAIIAVSEWMRPDPRLAMPGILALLILTGVTSPTEHGNRKVTGSERRAFRRILRAFLVGTGILSTICYLLGKEIYLNLILLTLLTVFVSMLIGKWRQN